MSNIFVKLGLVEEVESSSEILEQAMASVVEVNTITPVVANVPEDIKDEDTLVVDIFNMNELNDLSKSIYKVQDFLNTLPAEMPVEIKGKTVISILSASNISIVDVSDDAIKRLSVLESAKTDIKETSDKKINEAGNQIKELTTKIEELNSLIYDTKNSLTEAVSVIDKEMGNINSLKSVIGY